MIDSPHRDALQELANRIVAELARKKLACPQGREIDQYLFTKPYEVEDDDAKDGRKTIRVLKHYALFHA